MFMLQDHENDMEYRHGILLGNWHGHEHGTDTDSDIDIDNDMDIQRPGCWISEIGKSLM